MDQYKKKAQLYSTNVLMVQLGDDFRFDTPQEWDHQFQNYEKLIKYINGEARLNTRVSLQLVCRGNFERNDTVRRKLLNELSSFRFSSVP